MRVDWSPLASGFRLPFPPPVPPPISHHPARSCARPRSIWKGIVPTFFGYAAQGFCKFGFYEFFKDFYSNLAGEDDAKPANLAWLNEFDHHVNPC